MTAPGREDTSVLVARVRAARAGDSLLIDTVMRLRVPRDSSTEWGLLSFGAASCLFDIFSTFWNGSLFSCPMRWWREWDEVSVCAVFQSNDASFFEFLQGVYP